MKKTRTPASKSTIVPDSHYHGDEFPAELARAFEFAARKHDRQARKSTGIYYISHPMAVANLVMEAEGNKDQIIAALFHDLLEDTETSAQEIADTFGAMVLQIVQDCSDSISSEEKLPWKERKTKYIQHMNGAQIGSVLVSLADKTHNAKSIILDVKLLGPVVWKRFTANPADMKWYYSEMAKVFNQRLGNIESHGIQRLLAEFNRYMDELIQIAGGAVE